jgi:hypothetical protein
MTAEYSQAPCRSHSDEQAAYIPWGHDPEGIAEAEQLRAMVGREKLTELMQAVVDHREKSAADIVESVGIGGKLPKERGGMRKKVLAACKEFIKRGYADADLNDKQWLVAFLCMYDCTHAEIGQELGMSAATSSSNMARANAAVKRMDAANGVQRQQERG